MKLTTVVIAAAALAGAAGAASSASANATIFSEYQGSESAAGEGVYFSVTNNGPLALTDVNINGTDYGSLASGASTPFVFGADSSATANVTIMSGGNTYSGSFFEAYGDIDVSTAPIVDGTLGASTPEPATWAMMLAGFAALGAAFRMRRKALIPV
jgi:hypothetical protein